MPTTSASLDECLREVTTRVAELAGRSRPAQVDPNGLERLRGIPTAQQRRAAKTGYSFSSASASDQIAIWDHVWRHTNLMEVGHQALYSYQHRGPLAKHEFTKIRGWVDQCRCWEHSDDLSKIYAGVTEQHPDWILPALKRWNGSSNPWHRRQSVVALIEYANRRERFLPFEFMIAQVTALLDDSDYYVQKGVGWAIREIGYAYPTQTLAFLERNAARLAAQAWTGATKKMDKATKSRLKAMRAAGARQADPRC